MLSRMFSGHYTLILAITFFHVARFVSSLSVEELKPINYEVEILRVPVKKDDEPFLSSTTMMSIYGQEYRCQLPQIEEDEIVEKEPVSEKNSDVRELLTPLKSEPCLMKGKDWWTYEFCFGHYIKQFHIEDGKILGQVLTLGIYESDFDWNNETNKENIKKNSKQRYHSQNYVNGTKCDLTGQSRSTEVRFFCEEGVGDYIYRVDEPGTCSYIITIHTSRLCSHPLLKPPPSKKAHAIPCHPVVSEEQYTKYLQKLAEENELAEQKRLLWLSKQQEKLQIMKLENFLKTEESESVEKKETLEEKDSKVKDEAKYEDDSVLSDIEKKLESKLKEARKKLDEKTEIKLTEAEKAIQATEVKLEQMLKKLKALPEKLSSMKKNINDVLVLTDAEDAADYQWLKDAGGTADDFKFPSTLKMLLEKLEKAGNDLYKASKSIKKLKLEMPKKTSDVEEEDDSFISQIPKAADGEGEESVLDDNELTVRIRKLDHRKPDSSGQLYEMDVEQKEKLEQAVKEKLEKAGLDRGGRKIEVKIITGYYGNEGSNDVQSLTDEETDQFQNMIMALLVGQREALHEMERHKKLEDNYKLLWDEGEEVEE